MVAAVAVSRVTRGLRTKRSEIWRTEEGGTRSPHVGRCPSVPPGDMPPLAAQPAAFVSRHSTSEDARHVAYARRGGSRWSLSWRDASDACLLSPILSRAVLTILPASVCMFLRRDEPGYTKPFFPGTCYLGLLACVACASACGRSVFLFSGSRSLGKLGWALSG